ncbi:hypothetical protein [Tautonia rosea]|uniref:hypothetical protein n=1 Tax=Tautonia rosea TaxID=2728037 RepID=UPI0014740F81|nr:hypothetical protein [Tautonia rosea]
MPHAIEEFVRLAPEVWPEGAPQCQPGDLDQWAPMGVGLPPGTPIPVMPWDSPATALKRTSHLGVQPHSGHPFTGAPSHEPAGGTVYFALRRSPDDFAAMLRMMGVKWLDSTDYAAFFRESTDPADRYVSQLRVVPRFALKYHFRVPEGPLGEELRRQPLPLGEVLSRFVDHFMQAHREKRYPLDGLLGGDGDFAREFLGFGFSVENQYAGIYRIWTRAYIATK